MDNRGHTHRDARHKRLHRLAWFLDSSVPLPGGYRIGLDGLIGLIPTVGDVVGALLSSYILGEAARAGAPKRVLLRMAFNIALESIIGVIPVAGDLFDMAWKSNQRNVRLLDAYLAEPRKTSTTSGVQVAVIIVGTLFFVVAVAVLAILLAQWIWSVATT